MQIFLYLVLQGESWSWHQNLQEDWLGTKDEIDSSNSSLLYLLIHTSIWCHRKIILVMAPKLQEESLYLFIWILDVYSGFWCTSHCVVFWYSVPPLTDQVLQKVLLTSWKEVNYCCLVSKQFIECPIWLLHSSCHRATWFCG